jgi:hypothetical protein
LEGAEALAGVKILQHVQEELVEKSDLLRGDEQGLGCIIIGLVACIASSTSAKKAWCFEALASTSLIKPSKL